MDLDLNELLSEYLRLCNRVLAQNEHRFVFRQAKRLNRTLWGEAAFRALVYDEDPESVLGEFDIHFDPGPRLLTLGAPSSGAVTFTWKVPLDYLLDVVRERPDWYLEHPVMLDLNWLTERVRDEASGRREMLAAGVMGFAIGAAVGAATLRVLARR